MKDNKNWSTPAALEWMQIILEERFGHAIILQPHSNGRQLILKITEVDNYIKFDLDGATFSRNDSNFCCSMWNAANEGWQTALETVLHAPGLLSIKAPLIEMNEQGFHIKYDMLGMIYWMLTRQEEVGRTDLDIHERFQATSSHAFKFGYLERPVVDEWLYVLSQVINRQWPNIRLKKHNFIMRVSHDVDQPSLYAFKSIGQILRMMGGHLLKRYDILSFMQAPIVKLASIGQIHNIDPFNTFEWIMDQSDNQGLTSAFYFICGHTNPHDADYLPEDRRIRHLMRRIHERGHEIGLHPSYGSYQKPDLIHQEADRLRLICREEGIHQREWGGRMHYLRWEQPTTLQAWSDAGMNYDSSLGYADRPGFRCGTCFEYTAFNTITQQVLPLLIRPLVMMECSVIDDTYLGLGTGKVALDKALLLKNKCSKVGGVFTLLWHNSSLVSPASKNLFRQLIIK